MQQSAYGLLRIHHPGSRVDKGKQEAEKQQKRKAGALLV
jgi:hypothetical protein